MIPQIAFNPLLADLQASRRPYVARQYAPNYQRWGIKPAMISGAAAAVAEVRRAALAAVRVKRWLIAHGDSEPPAHIAEKAAFVRYHADLLEKKGQPGGQT
jgi:hypothetical protein